MLSITASGKCIDNGWFEAVHELSIKPDPKRHKATSSKYNQF